jgi:peptidoglycan hydrolase-like protein with peptidoglycan-binding domain
VYPGQPLRLGSQGEAVKHVQRVVGATQDGDYGAATERRVKAWQKQRKMFVDGVVGPVTWKAMFG